MKKILISLMCIIMVVGTSGSATADAVLNRIGDDSNITISANNKTGITIVPPANNTITPKVTRPSTYISTIQKSTTATDDNAKVTLSADGTKAIRKAR